MKKMHRPISPQTKRTHTDILTIQTIFFFFLLGAISRTQTKKAREQRNSNRHSQRPWELKTQHKTVVLNLGIGHGS